jgi:hypothetical protein
MRRYTVAVGIALTLAGGFTAHAQQPVWQIHAVWCTKDGGSSGNVYRQTCGSHDQFDSVIACQQDAGNGGAVQALRDAGRATVNAYMDNYKLTSCQ